MNKVFYHLITLFVFVSSVYAQEPNIQWKKDTTTKSTDIQLFHSIHAVNLPTSETLKKGEFEYEISHRFVPSIDSEQSMLGIDGPANIRTALSYALTNSVLLTFGRSNLDDNYDFRAKLKLWQIRNKHFPLSIAARAGTAWNTQVINRDVSDAKNFQYYGQLIANTLIGKRIGIGVVPSYLYNSHIYCTDTEYSFTIGSYLQWYMTTMMSFVFESNTTVTGYRGTYNPVTLGIELETGGHFFKIFVSNSDDLNPTQFLNGANQKAGKYSRLGFSITRILAFSK